MNTLELTLQRKTDSGYPVIAALTRPGGFLPLRREGALNLDIPTLGELQFEPLEYGKALGQALFVDEIRDTFVKALGDEPLRVLLSVEAPDLRALDWHRLAAPFDGRWRFLASQQNTPFSLSIPSPASAHFPALGRRDLRALLLVAGPESLSGDYRLAPFDVAATIASVQIALSDIPCDILDNPSLDALCAALTATPYTLLHLVCHGAVNERGKTILYFPKDERRTPTLASDLLNRLGSLARLPHFAFISACESALPQNGLGSLAGRLVRELGLPAVLAMTDRVSIATASAIAAPFYAHLYQHGQPDLALAQSLAGLQGAHDLTVPAIFSRLGDRPLFDDNSERALTDKELEFGLAKLAESLPERAPVMDSLHDALTRRLRSTLGADSKSLSESSRTERKETLDGLNSLSLEALDLSFNALCLGQTPPAYDSRSPFRGLESFRPEDAAYFFGRETLTRKLVQKLNEHNFLAILGASGSGKSSLVMAGLIPALNIPYSIFRPGAEPLSELDKALQAGPQLLVVDQFEELFTLSAREQRPDFISLLLEQSHRLRVVITLRADFLGEVAPFKSLKDEVQNHQEIIPPMDEAELRRAMEGQAGCAGLRFEADLSQQMLDDVSGEPGAMPLLQHALWTLWTRRHGRWLRAEEYRAFGGVKQAIASTAEAVFTRCSEFEKERVRDIFLRLTRLDDSADRRDTRRHVLLRDLIPADSGPESTKLLIKQLADARMVVVTGDEVEVAHEALIRHWERLRAWLNDDRDNLRLREDVSDNARRWENAEWDESLLNHRGARLELALAMSKNPRYRLNPVEQAYLDECMGLTEREKAAAAMRKRDTIAGVIAALVVIMAILVGWGWTRNQNATELNYQVATAQAAQSEANQAKALAQSSEATAIANGILAQKEADKAKEQSLIARSQELALEAQMLSEKKPELALLLALESLRNLPATINHNPQAEQALRDALRNFFGWVLNTDNSPVDTFEISSSGRFIGNISNSQIVTNNFSTKSIQVWDLNDLIYSNPVEFPVPQPKVIAFSSDEKLIASGNWDGSVYLWDVQNNKAPSLVKFQNKMPIFDIKFSPDVGSLAISTINHDTSSGNFDRRIWLWKLNNEDPNPIVLMDAGPLFSFGSTGRWLVAQKYSSGIALMDLQHLDVQPIMLRGSTGYEKFFAFHPDGSIFVNVDSENTVRIWNINQPTAYPFTLSHSSDEITSLEFSPDGMWIACGFDSGTIRLWQLNSIQNKPIELTGNTGRVLSLAYAQDGKWLASSFSSGVVKIWDVTILPNEIATMKNNSDIKKIAFGAIKNNIWLLGVTQNGKMRLWNMQNRSEEPLEIRFASEIKNFKSEDGRWLASIKTNGSISLLDMQKIFLTRGDTAPIEINTRNPLSVLTFSKRNTLLAGGSSDGSISIWKVNDPAFNPIFLSNHTSPVIKLAISPDESWLVSASSDNITLFWNLNLLNSYPTKLITADGERIKELMFSPDSQWMVRVVDGCNNNGLVERKMELWDIQEITKNPSWLPKSYLIKSPAELCGTETQNPQVNQPLPIIFSPDGKWLITQNRENRLSILNLKNPADNFPSIVGSIPPFAFSPDSKLLASGGEDGSIHIFKIDDVLKNDKSDTNNNTPTPISPIQRRFGHEGILVNLIFSEDGYWLISQAEDQTIRIWDVQNEFSDPVLLPAFKKGGGYISTGREEIALADVDENITIRLWHLNIDVLIELACQAIGRNLSGNEMSQYFPGEEYRITCPQWPREP